MYNEKIFLTPKEILDKEFKIDARGYRPQEVDKFLDMLKSETLSVEVKEKKLNTEELDLNGIKAKIDVEKR